MVAIVATNANLKRLVAEHIERLGPTCDLNHIDVSGVTSFSELFMHLPFNGDVSRWDVSRGTDFTLMFAHSAFNGDISQWNMSSAMCLDNMFFNGAFDNDVSQWDVGNVRYAKGVFFNTPFDGDLSAWRLHPECLELLRLADMVAHPQPGARKHLRLPMLPLEARRLFLSEQTLDAWLEEAARHGHVTRYHWDALLRNPLADWATPAMAQHAALYLSLVPDAASSCIEHAELLLRAWESAREPGAAWSLPALDDPSP